ncbi:MAG: Wzz/FepE/Etk N-terminal domain-containing protein [Anaerolineae bacterium]
MDIYEYTDAIARHLGLILVLTLLAMLVAAVVNLFIPPTYEATAILSVPRLSSSIPLASLIKSNEVEAQVIAALSARNPIFPGGQVPERLIHDVEVTEGPNMVRITARSDTARKGALMANTWADFAVERISEAQLKEGQQLKTAEQNLEAANEALKAFENEYGFGIFGFGTAEEDLEADKERLKTYQLRQESLQQSIEEARTFRKTIRGGDTGTSAKAISPFVINLLQEVAKKSEDGIFQVQVLLMEQQVDQQLIEQYETTMENIETALEEARNLRDAVEQGGSIGSPELMSSLIVDFLESGSTESAIGIDVQALSLPTEDISPSQQMAILDTIISILEGREALIATGMDQLSVKTVETLDAAISALDTEEKGFATRIEELSTDISQREEILTEKKPELERLIVARVEAEEIYMSLADKMQQAEFIAEPKVIASAMEPREPIWPNKMRNIGLAGALGLVVGLFLAFREERVKGELVWW